MAKIGRNDPCPCGSGQKYKRCCLEKDEAAAREASHTVDYSTFDAPAIHHFHCAACGATYPMEHEACECAKCDAVFETGGTWYDDDEDEGYHVHCGKCNEPVRLPPYCGGCGVVHGDLPEVCPACGATLEDAVPVPPTLYHPEPHDDDDAYQVDPEDFDDDFLRCSACFFDLEFVSTTECPNCGVSLHDVEPFCDIDGPPPPDPAPEDWLWCARCYRLFQARDMRPGIPPAFERCPFDDCDGEDYCLDLFRYCPPEGAPAARKGMKHPNAELLRESLSREDDRVS